MLVFLFGAGDQVTHELAVLDKLQEVHNMRNHTIRAIAEEQYRKQQQLRDTAGKYTLQQWEQWIANYPLERTT